MKTSNRLIAVSAIVTMAVVILANVQKNKDIPPPRVWVGYGAAFAVTSVFADLGSPIGGALALLIMTAALANYGVDAFGLITARSQTKTPLTKPQGATHG